MQALKKIIRFLRKYLAMSRRVRASECNHPQIMNRTFFIVFNILLLTIVNTILISAFQRDIISSVRAVGVQCNVDYIIEIPVPEIEDIKE